MSLKSALPLLLLAAVAGVAAGFFFGKERALATLTKRVESFERTETLGGIAKERREGMALTFDDPDRAAAEMDGYVWSVSNMPSPFVGVAPAPGQHTGAFINANQMRHATDLAIPKPPGVFRVFVTGGSTAFGTGAPDDSSTVTAYLQQLVDQDLPARNIEIVNAANPAWASTHERILITNRLSELEPDLVVSLSGNNDAHFGFLGLHVLWFRTYAEHFYGLLISDMLETLGKEPLPIPWNPSIGEPVPAEEVLRRLVKNLRLASLALEETGAHYVFALQPTLAETGKPRSERERKHLEEESLGDGCTDYFREVYALYESRLPELEITGLHFVDVSDALDGFGAVDELFLDSYHFGDRGNRALAERLFEELRPFLE